MNEERHPMGPDEVEQWLRAQEILARLEHYEARRKLRADRYVTSALEHLREFGHPLAEGCCRKGA